MVPRRVLVLSVAAAAVATTLAVPGVAAKTKPGASCPKVGRTAVIGSTKYVCKRTTGRLIWTKATASASAASPATPTTTPSATATPSPTSTFFRRPISVMLQPASPAEGASCSPLGDEQFSNIGPIRCTSQGWKVVAPADDSVMTRAFRFLFQRWNAVKGDPVTAEIYVRPTLTDWGPWAIKAFEAGARYWRASEGKMLVRSIVSDDGPWLEAKANELGWPIHETLREALTNRPWSTLAINAPVPPDGSPRQPWIHMLDEGGPSPGLNTGMSHEFGHVAQLYLSGDRIGRSFGGKVPWLEEGSPSYVGAALSPLVGMRHNTREDWLERVIARDVSLVDVSDFAKAPGGSEIFSRAYAAGFFATEALTAIYGADCIDDFYRGIANGQSMDSSFRGRIGIGLLETSRVLDGYVQSVRARKPWTLEELQRALTAAGARPGLSS